MLDKNPKNRITINQIALHPWVNKECKDLALELYVPIRGFRDTRVVDVTDEDMKKSVNSTIMKSIKPIAAPQ